MTKHKADHDVQKKRRHTKNGQKIKDDSKFLLLKFSKQHTLNIIDMYVLFTL